MSTLQLMIISILIVMAVLGFLYAYVIYLNPWRRTWLEVVVGVGFTILGEMTLIIVALWHYGYLSEIWWMALIPPTCYAATGISQIYWQEKKGKQGRKKAKWALRKFNGQEVIKEE